MLDDGAGSDLSQLFTAQSELGDESRERRREHILVGGFGVCGVAAGKGNARAADDRDAPENIGHGTLPPEKLQGIYATP